MNLEASIKLFNRELCKPASRDDFMCYDRDDRSRHPTNRQGAAFKNGWGHAHEVLKQNRDRYRSATLRRLTWCNLGYRFVMWHDAKGQEPCDPATAYKLFKRMFGVREPPGSDRGRVVEPPGPPDNALPLAEDGYVRASRNQLKIIIPRHNRLSNAFVQWLRKHGYEDVQQERGGVDVDFLHGATSCRAELKVCCGVTTKHAIREALGQLLEYNYYGGRKLAKKWFIVLDRTPSQKDREFVTKLRRAMGFPLSICWQTGNTFGVDP